MRKALYLLLALGLLAIAAFGVVGSAAWFTDGSTVPISATGATLDIRAEVGPPGGTPTYYDPTGVELSVANLAPGALSDKVMISVQNKPAPASTLDVKYRYTASKTTSTPGFWAALNVQVEYGACVGHDLGFVAGTIYDGPLNALSFTSIDNDYNTGDYLAVNETHCYRFAFYLDETAGNELQGGNATFDIVIDATQPGNPGWAES
ncbi:MAG TPA: hypothetical protein VLA29_04210 [Acidimicrobiia bacterium]|nr:hypothetical protein [Acidimicrobiia bacterium]